MVFVNAIICMQKVEVIIIKQIVVVF